MNHELICPRCGSFTPYQDYCANCEEYDAHKPNGGMILVDPDENLDFTPIENLDPLTEDQIALLQWQIGKSDNFIIATITEYIAEIQLDHGGTVSDICELDLSDYEEVWRWRGHWSGVVKRCRREKTRQKYETLLSLLDALELLAPKTALPF